MKDSSVLHEIIIKGKKGIPILNRCLSRGGRLISTNIDSTIVTNTSLPDGLYRRIGSDWVLDGDLGVEEFPDCVFDGVPRFKISLDFTANMVGRLRLFSEGNERYNGIVLQVKERELYLYATNGKILTWEFFGETDITDDITYVVHSDVLLRVLSKCKPYPLRVGIVFYENFMLFEVSTSVKVFVRKIEKVAPNIWVLGVKFDKGFLVNRAVILDALKTLKHYATDSNFTCCFDFTKQKVFAIHPEVGRKEVDIDIERCEPQKLDYKQAGSLIMPIKYDKMGSDISLNLKWLLELFSKMKGDIVMSVKDRENPVLFRGVV